MNRIAAESFFNKYIYPFLYFKSGFASPIYKTSKYFDTEVFIKRDDMLFNNISGTKLRKINSILYYTKSRSLVIEAIGSAHSNMLLALAGLLKQENVDFKFYVKRPRSENNKGNYLLLKAIAKNNLIEISNDEFSFVEDKFNLEYTNSNLLLLNEGAFIPESFPGLWTLGYEIFMDFDTSEIPNNIFIDSGSGATSISLILFLESINYLGTIHITLVAGNKEDFINNYLEISLKLNRFFESDFFGKKKQNIKFYNPLISKSFGSQNHSVWKEWQKIAEDLGILTDIVYTTKHFYTIKNLLKELNLKNPPLIISCGGGGLFGMEENIQKTVD